MDVPASVVESFSGEPIDGALDAVCFLVTASSDRLPMVCLLSRRQVSAHGDKVNLLVRSRRTLANLKEDSPAVLHVICDDAAWSIVLALDELYPDHLDGATLAKCSVVTIEEDRIAETLEPARYLATNELTRKEGASIDDD